MIEKELITADFGPGKYFIGDICYGLDAETYLEEFGKKYNYQSGDYGKYAVAKTAYGDGIYTGSDGIEYGVDAGILGIVDLSTLPTYNEDLLNKLGRVIECNNLTMSAEGGIFTFNFDGNEIVIDTTEDFEDEFEEEVEENFDYDSSEEEYNSDDEEE